MSIDGIRKALTQAKRNDGKVDVGELDRLMLQARDSGGIDATERAELLKVADGFDDGVKQRLLKHLSAATQANAWVNLESAGKVKSIDGRYAKLDVGVPGLTGSVGLFDNVFALKGQARQAGTLSLTVEGKSLSVEVKKGDKPAAIFARLQAKLPAQVTGVLFGGDVRPWEPESFTGAGAKASAEAAHLALYKPEALGLKPGERPLRVVVTGYGAFMGITDNPSANLALKLAELGVKGGIVEYRRLDVNHGAVQEFMREMKAAPPDVILSMGVSSSSQVEELPENVVGSGRDGDDKPITPGVVRPGAPDVLKTDLPVEQIDAALRPFGEARVIGTSKSDPDYAPDRSAYLCNYLGFNLADAFGSSAATTAGFVHMTQSTPAEQMHALLEAVVARQLDVRRGVAVPRS